jgi:hypothetical protein
MPSRRLSSLIAAGALVCTLPSGVFADPAADPAAPGAAGSWINVDPQTGKRIPVPSSGAGVQVPADPAFSTSHSGLVEQAAPGGGVMVDLQGRFRSAATATVGPDGTVHLDCVTPGHTGHDAHQ